MDSGSIDWSSTLHGCTFLFFSAGWPLGPACRLFFVHKKRGGRSVPAHVVGIGAFFFPLEVLEEAALGADGEVVALPAAEGVEAPGDGEAVEVAGDVAGGGGYLVGVEVVGGGEAEVPLVAYLEAAAGREAVGESVGLAHVAGVDGG